MKWLFMAVLVASTSSAWALEPDSAQRLGELQQRWAQIQYQLPKAQRSQALEQLAGESAVFVKQHPGQAEPLIWDGIINSTWAGATGGLGALSKVKAARASLEQAIALDPGALQGSAYTSLGTLYDQVPGWPIGFGDSDKAEALLRQALRINPTGIDSNYFWADHLVREKHFTEARQALHTALKAAPRPGRELADQGRRKDIQALLAAIADKQD